MESPLHRFFLIPGKGATLSKGKYLYEGDFVDGKRHGHGVLSTQQPDGSFALIYRGHWRNGHRHVWFQFHAFCFHFITRVGQPTILFIYFFTESFFCEI